MRAGRKGNSPKFGHFKDASFRILPSDSNSLDPTPVKAQQTTQPHDRTSEQGLSEEPPMQSCTVRHRAGANGSLTRIVPWHRGAANRMGRATVHLRSHRRNARAQHYASPKQRATRREIHFGIGAQFADVGRRWLRLSPSVPTGAWPSRPKNTPLAADFRSVPTFREIALHCGSEPLYSSVRPNLPSVSAPP
jgi:hypothetical protein